MSGFSEYESYDAIGLADVDRRTAMSAPERCWRRRLRGARHAIPALNAVVQELYEHGRDMAGANCPSRPLAGAPYLIKDLGAAIAGTPTTGGSKFMEDVVPDADSETVIRAEVRPEWRSFGKDQHLRVRYVDHVRAAVLWPDEEPLGW